MYGWDEYGGYGWMPEDFGAAPTDPIQKAALLVLQAVNAASTF